MSTYAISFFIAGLFVARAIIIGRLFYDCYFGVMYGGIDVRTRRLGLPSYGRRLYGVLELLLLSVTLSSFWDCLVCIFYCFIPSGCVCYGSERQGVTLSLHRLHRRCHFYRSLHYRCHPLRCFYSVFRYLQPCYCFR
jgi:hypothetical protein